MKLLHSIFILLLFCATLSCSNDEDPIVNPPVSNNQPPLAPDNPIPADGSTLKDFTNLTLSWNSSDPDGDEITYAVLLSLAPSDFGLEADNLRNDSLVLDILEPGKTYYWKVRAKDSQGLQTESDIFQFSIDAKVFSGDVNLSTQKDLVDFGSQGYTHILGSLHLGGEESDILDLTHLSSLYSIESSLEIERIPAPNLLGLDGLTIVGHRLQLLQNYQLKNLTGLQNLQSVGYLEIEENHVLEDFTGLQSIKHIADFLGVWGNPLIQDLRGLENISMLASLSISDNPLLENLVGLNNLVNCGDLLIENNESLTGLSGLEKLQFIDGSLELDGNPHLRSLVALSSLTTIVWSLKVYQSPGLIDLQGLNRLSQLGSLNFFDNSSLRSLDGLDNLTFCNSISLRNQLSLENLKALSSLTETGSITIMENPVLTSLEGLHDVRESAGSVFLFSNSLLADLSGLRGLQTVEERFTIESNGALKDITGLQELVNVGEDIHVYDNLIISLNGLDNLLGVGGDIFIEDNSELSDFCALQTLIVKGGWSGDLNINGNRYDPSLRDIGNGICKL